MLTRRRFLSSTAATAGAVTVLPYAALAEAHMGHVFETAAGPITVHPVSHASFVMETPAGVIYVDPVGGADAYADLPGADLILITHEHGDHYDAETLEALHGPETRFVTNPAVGGMLPEAIAAKNQVIANGEATRDLGVEILAIPAYNITEGRLNFHPQGRDNGYVLNFEDFVVYVSGDTEGVPEMRALEGIDLAFVCMNLPFTMAAEQAADAVAEFAPAYVFPYHYRGRDDGTQDPEEFARLLAEAGAITEVRMGAWY
ncbi:MBL fold metallo-hydrolase [Rhodobacteraceae bacterium CCMM004]|nr:MBL fold metallo-hydrolase [Rhodobacteraceae bacterium CCMM004]